MRVTAKLAALLALVLVAGCDAAPGGRGDGDSSADLAAREAAAAFATTGSPFDYRYAYRLPGDMVKKTIESNAEACERLGEQRCTIMAMRYRVENATRVSAVLTVKIDPAIARAFGDAVTDAVGSAGGELVNTEVSSGEAVAGRSASVVEQLGQALEAAEAAQADDDAAAGRAERIRQALATIREVQGPEGLSLATTPVLMTYESSSALSPIGSDPQANLRSAGQTFERSLAGLLQVLAGVGPWLVLAIVLVFILRLVIHGTGGGAAAAEADPVPNAVPVRDDGDGDGRNLIQRWFAREDDEDR